MRSAACKVMIVDDNQDAADAAAILLEEWGHETVVAYSASDCLALAPVFNPDVVLMDIGLPWVDGFELAPKVEAVCPGVRLVALTGFTQADIVRRAHESGFADFLAKPVEGAVLKSAVDNQCTIAKSL